MKTNVPDGIATFSGTTTLCTSALERDIVMNNSAKDTIDPTIFTFAKGATGVDDTLTFANSDITKGNKTYKL